MTEFSPPNPPYGPPGSHPWPSQHAGSGPPGYDYYAPTSARTNGMAIASMVLGILWIYWIGSVLALVFGYGILVVVDVPEPEVREHLVALSGRPRGVVQVRHRLARLRLRVQRTLSRWVVGPRVPVSVRLIGVHEQEPGFEADGRAVVLPLAVHVESGAIPHLHVVGVIGG